MTRKASTDVGPLHISTADGGDPLLEDVITAGTELEWQRALDLNEADEERIGYAMATIRDGRRCSAANAFLHPVMNRPNLTVAPRTCVARVVLDGGRAVGIQGRQDGQAVEYHATREVMRSSRWGEPNQSPNRSSWSVRLVWCGFEEGFLPVSRPRGRLTRRREARPVRLAPAKHPLLLLKW